jgi:precorrin-6B methylase 2
MARIFLVSRVSSYRRLARELVGSDDLVIELGSSEGRCTRLLAGRAQRVIAVEKTRDGCAKTREAVARCDNVDVLCQDAFELKPILDLTPCADAVFVDIGGSAPAWQTMRLAGNYLSIFHPDVLVMRNTRLASFVSSLEWAERDTPGRYWTSSQDGG